MSLDNENAELKRRQKGRNWAVFSALIFLVVLFYAITLARMGG